MCHCFPWLRNVRVIGACTDVCLGARAVQRGNNCSKEAVGRNPMDAPAFVDERKSPSNVGSFHSRCLGEARVCAAEAQAS